MALQRCARTRPAGGEQRNEGNGEEHQENNQEAAGDHAVEDEIADDGENVPLFITRHAPPKLEEASNYRRWANDVEMILWRMKAWELIKQPLPAGGAGRKPGKRRITKQVLKYTSTATRNNKT